MTGCVYRAYADDGSLLYVGSSNHPTARYGYHELNSPWWLFKADVREEWHPSLAVARYAELVAIETEHPRWNVHGRSHQHPDGPMSSWATALHLAEDVAQWRQWRSVRGSRHCSQVTS